MSGQKLKYELLDDINHLEYKVDQLTRDNQALTTDNQELSAELKAEKSRNERFFNFNECHFNLI